MSDETLFPEEAGQVPLMSAVKARDIGRAHQGWATYLRGQGLRAEARVAEQQAQWWMTYAISLSQTPPGASDDR